MMKLSQATIVVSADSATADAKTVKPQMDTNEHE
jgi:hypothetical protein